MCHSVIGALCAVLIASHLGWLRPNNLFSFPIRRLAVLSLCRYFSTFVNSLLMSFCRSCSALFGILSLSLFFRKNRLSSTDLFFFSRKEKSACRCPFSLPPAPPTHPPITHPESARMSAAPQITPPINNRHPNHCCPFTAPPLYSFNIDHHSSTTNARLFIAPSVAEPLIKTSFQHGQRGLIFSPR